MKAWISNETKTADFNDARLELRYAILLDQLSDKPSLSIPAACRGVNDTTAAYRFYDNDKTSFHNVLQPHSDATIERIRTYPVVLVAQDTTELDLTRPNQKVGGPLNDLFHFGVYAHPLLAMTPERIPLGVIDAKVWSRNEKDFDKSQEQKRIERREKPFVEKESYRWLEGYQSTCDLADQVPTTSVISIADSESDIYELLQAGENGAAEFIIRGCQDRGVLDEDASRMLSALESRPRLGTLQVRISKREASTTDESKKRKQARVAREATVTIRSMRLLLRPPYRENTQERNNLRPIEVNVVLAREENPPAGETGIQWYLFTSLPIETYMEATQVLDYYCSRWEIEIYFHVLKSGCKVEDLRFETQARFEVCLGMYMIVAWRVLYLLRLGRECPEMSCDGVLSESEWKSVYQIVKKRKPPTIPPSLNEIIRMIAELGGFINRKSSGDPGAQTMWIGLQRMRDFALAYETFRESEPVADVPQKPASKDV